MNIVVTHSERTARVALRGRFDFHCHREFKNAWEGVLTRPEVAELDIDLGDVDYLDSSGLGMLLLARERATAVSRTIRLANCRGAVEEVLRVAHLDRLFQIR